MLEIDEIRNPTWNWLKEPLFRIKSSFEWAMSELHWMKNEGVMKSWNFGFFIFSPCSSIYNFFSGQVFFALTYIGVLYQVLGVCHSWGLREFCLFLEIIEKKFKKSSFSFFHFFGQKVPPLWGHSKFHPKNMFTVLLRSRAFDWAPILCRQCTIATSMTQNRGAGR